MSMVEASVTGATGAVAEETVSVSQTSRFSTTVFTSTTQRPSMTTASSMTATPAAAPVVNAKNGLSGGEISGIVLGVLTFFVTVVGIWYAKRSARFQELVHGIHDQGHQQQVNERRGHDIA
ncbi:hypothetical protein ABW21_db0203461 [Orbilia brochopaga]|nr:hypothetical protein ABW21_db0203461 [Drechslerella brochopaga]